MYKSLIFLAIGSATYGILKVIYPRYAPITIAAPLLLKGYPLNRVSQGLAAGAIVDLASKLVTGNFDFLHFGQSTDETSA